MWEDGQPIRPISSVFQDQTVKQTKAIGYPARSLSVFLGSELSSRGIELEELLASPEWQGNYGVVSVTAGIVRALGQGVHRDPIPTNPAHALVFSKIGTTRSTTKCKELAKASEIVIAPPQAPDGD